MILAEGAELKDNNNEIYIIKKFIDNGGFAYVYLAQRKSDQRYFAIKAFLNAFDTVENYNSFLNEITLAQQISSPHAIKYEFVNDGIIYPELPLYIIMEYAEKGSLKKELIERKEKHEFYNEHELIKIFLELAYGMKDVNKILVHRDIKPENILVTNHGLKISDFGLAKYKGESTRYITFKGYGTAPYCAPEVWNNDKNSELMDIYSMGIVFYELATLNYPYDICSDDYREAHLYKNIQPISKWNKTLSVGLSSMITKMLEKSKSKRFHSWDEIINWIENDEMYSKTEISHIVEMAVNTQIIYDISRQKAEAEMKKRRVMTENWRILF